jgi:peptidoglycan lytic transglycosylase G
MNDILPPKRPLSQSSQPVPEVKKEELLLEQPEQPPLLEAPKHRSRAKIVLWVLAGLVALLLLVGAGLVAWYQGQLRPVDPNNKDKTRISIETGSSPTMIANLLEEKKLIRSSLAFDVYTRLAGVQATLQAGSYSLSPSESTQQIVTHLTSGKIDEFSITFLPGATLAENREGLISAGYGVSEVDAALNKTYDHPLFADKPALADLEGYIYGETYNFESSATVEQVLKRTFDEYYEVIKANDLVAKFKAQELNLYQGITLASIVQREVAKSSDQKQVAQVFFKRLHDGMPLGADATFVYGAKKLGIDPSVDVDSPYNTRVHAGLPPGPIAAPGLTALQAVADPAPGDFVYFVSGDDGTTHFSRTEAEHQANTQQYCHKNCNLF